MSFHIILNENSSVTLKSQLSLRRLKAFQLISRLRQTIASNMILAIRRLKRRERIQRLKLRRRRKRRVNRISGGFLPSTGLEKDDLESMEATAADCGGRHSDLLKELFGRSGH